MGSMAGWEFMLTVKVNVVVFLDVDQMYPQPFSYLDSHHPGSIHSPISRLLLV